MNALVVQWVAVLSLGLCVVLCTQRNVSVSISHRAHRTHTDTQHKCAYIVVSSFPLRIVLLDDSLYVALCYVCRGVGWGC